MKVFILVLVVLLSIPVITAQHDEKLYSPVGINYFDLAKELNTCSPQLYTRSTILYTEYIDKVCYCT